MRLFEDITYTDEELQPIVNFCEVNQEFSPVVTKFNKDNQWTAISLRGYGSESTQIGKGVFWEQTLKMVYRIQYCMTHWRWIKF